MDVVKYLERIGYRGPVVPNEAVLRELCWAHVTNVPFYTLDMFGSNERKTMSMKQIYRNIVERKLGGMCYELNAMFSWLLKQIGFELEIIKAEAYSDELKDYGTSRTHAHMTLIVTLAEGIKRIADVSALAIPIRMDCEEPQDQRNTKARARKEWCNREKDWYICVEKLQRTEVEEGKSGEVFSNNGTTPDKKWKARYRFRSKFEGVKVDNFQENIDYMQDNEDSEFRKISFCGLQHEHGFKGLICMTYILKNYINDYKEYKSKQEMKTIEEAREILMKEFHVNLDYKPMLPGLETNIF